MPQVVCEECGFRGSSLNERAHGVRHDEHLNGVRLRRLDRFERVGAIGAFQILLVRPDSDLFSRRRAERVSRRAIREPLFEGGYDKPTFYAENRYQIVPEMQSHALLAESRLRGVALVVIERRDRDAWFAWSDAEEKYVLASRQSAGVYWSLAHIWVLPAFRREGLATRLLEMAFRGFSMSPSTAGWLTPFSNGGYRLVRHFSPDGFWHAGGESAAVDSFARPFDYSPHPTPQSFKRF